MRNMVRERPDADIEVVLTYNDRESAMVRV